MKEGKKKDTVSGANGKKGKSTSSKKKAPAGKTETSANKSAGGKASAKKRAAVAKLAAPLEPTVEEIAVAAYHIYQERLSKSQHGDPQTDWELAKVRLRESRKARLS